MKSFDVVFDALDELRLIFTYSPTDMRTNEQSIETGENAEHLVGVFGGSQLITQMGSNSCLHAV